MALQSRSDCCPATSWRPHGGYEEHVLNLVEWFLLRFAVVPSLVIHVLTEEFKWWLRAVFFLLWHVQVVDEDGVFLAHRWSINALSSLVKLLIEVVLRLICRGLRREGHGKRKELLRHFIGNKLRGVNRFTSSSWPWTQNVLSVGEQKSAQILHTNGVIRGHDNLLERRFDVDFVSRNSFEPFDPLFLGAVVLVIVDESVCRDAHAHFRQEFAAECIELQSSFEVGSAAVRPDEGKREEGANHGQQIVNLVLADLFDFSLDIVCQVAVHDPKAALDDVVVHGDHGFHHVVTNEVCAFLEELVAHFLQLLLDAWVRLHSFRKCVKPRVEVRFQTQ